MKALIFNSGTGSRLGSLSTGSPKAMLRLSSGETLFHRQLRLLYACGIRKFIITTGPFREQLEAEASPFENRGCSFQFVHNRLYEQTNYIYSMHLAEPFLRGDDIIMLHGDLVFDREYARKVIEAPSPSICSVNRHVSKPEKDFKARIADGRVREISVSIMDEDCLACQPFYKLSATAMEPWLDRVALFVRTGQVSCYAEDAANEIMQGMDLQAFSYDGHFVEEIDTPDDLLRVREQIRSWDYRQQPVFRMNDDGCKLLNATNCPFFDEISDVTALTGRLGMRRPLVVASSAFDSSRIEASLDSGPVEYAVFRDFKPNPTIEHVELAHAAFRDMGCDSLISVGGGSAMDVAKCLKQLISFPDGTPGGELASASLPYSDIPHIAVPTTAGSGSESTHFAVCYIQGTKHSIANDCLLPDAAILDPSMLSGLPEYQKKATMLDALCQAIESFWSRKATPASRELSRKAASAILADGGSYVAGDPESAWTIMEAANDAGKAINLTTTTAPHAMSYKLTSLYHLPHGHAVALCMPECWGLLIGHMDGSLKEALAAIASLMTGNEKAAAEEGLEAFKAFYNALAMPEGWRTGISPGDAAVLAHSVEPQRLSNFPIVPKYRDLERMYEQILHPEPPACPTGRAGTNSEDRNRISGAVDNNGNCTFSYKGGEA